MNRHRRFGDYRMESLALGRGSIKPYRYEAER